MMKQLNSHYSRKEEHEILWDVEYNNQEYYCTFTFDVVVGDYGFEVANVCLVKVDMDEYVLSREQAIKKFGEDCMERNENTFLEWAMENMENWV